MKILNHLQSIFSLFKLFKKKDSSKINIPNSFSGLEKITRTIFSPINMKKNDLLRNNSFTTPAEKDEVSVNRLYYTTANFIKKIGKLISNPEKDREYYGVAVINVDEIYDCDSDIVYSPNRIESENLIVENPYHSDIKIGYEKEVGKPLPMSHAYKVEKMVKYSRFYKDNSPSSEDWEGEELE